MRTFAWQTRKQKVMVGQRAIGGVIMIGNKKNICRRSFNPAQSFNIYTDSLRKTWKSQKFPKSPKIFGDIPKSPKIQKFPNLSIFGDEIPKMATLVETDITFSVTLVLFGHQHRDFLFKYNSDTHFLNVEHVAMFHQFQRRH